MPRSDGAAAGSRRGGGSGAAGGRMKRGVAAASSSSSVSTTSSSSMAPPAARPKRGRRRSAAKAAPSSVAPSPRMPRQAVSSTTPGTPRRTAMAAMRRPAVPASPMVVSSSSKRRRRSGALPPVARRSIGASVAAGRAAGATLSATSEAAGAANIRVCVRIRPENEREFNSGKRNVIEIIDDKMLVFDPKDTGDEFYYKGKLQTRRDLNKRAKRDHRFAYDVVLGPESDNQQVFEKSTKDLVDVIFGGYNCSVFVYGATGAGKTFTMLGSPSNPGLTYRTVLELYQRVEAVREEVACEIVVSYLEVYNETVIDLINPGKPLTIREDGNSGVAVLGLSMHKPAGPEHLLELLHMGNSNRTQHPTDANAESSRSHAVFQVTLQQKSRSTGLSADMKLAKLSMIDLAGSERGTVAMAAGATRLREGANINKSLLALGNCITSLADGNKYVPYRDSKLTRLLKDSLGGNCRTVMISNVSPSALTFEDTYNTLKYADRAKRIKVKLRRNVAGGGAFNELQVAQYARSLENAKSALAAVEAENARLKKELEEARRSKAEPVETAEMATQCEPMEELPSEPKSTSTTNLPLTRVEQSIQVDLAPPPLTEPTPPSTSKQESDLSKVDSALAPLVQRHKSCLRRAREAAAVAKVCKLRRDLTQRILDRSALVSLKEDSANKKIERYIRHLDRERRKEERKERKRAAQLAETRRKLEEALEENKTTAEGDVVKEVERRIWTEVDCQDWKTQATQLIDLFSLAWHEQQRTDKLLAACLPQLKEHFLLLSSYEQSADRIQQYRDLVQLVQCQKVQFNLDPEVKHFEKDQAHEDGAGQAVSDVEAVQSAESLEPSGNNFRSRKLSVGGLGPLYEFAANFGFQVEEDEEAVPEDEDAHEDEKEEEEVKSEVVESDKPDSAPRMAVGVPRITLQAPSVSSSLDCTPPTPPVVSSLLAKTNSADSSNLDSTFTLEEEDDKENKSAGDSTFVMDSSESKANATFTKEDDDDVFVDDADETVAQTSPKIPWRPATPPKSRRNSSEKENASPTKTATMAADGSSSTLYKTATMAADDSSSTLYKTATMAADDSSPAMVIKPLGASNRTSFFKSPIE